MPEKRTLELVAWDVTETTDTVGFIKLMRQRLGWHNLLDEVAKGTKYVERTEGQSIFTPCGKTGENSTPELFRETHLFQQQVFAPNHGTGREPALFYISGHGIPGFIFSNNTEGIPIVNSNIIGDPGDIGYSSSPAYQWNSDQLKYVIFSSCRQLSGTPQQALWARALRGEKPLHGILGYRDTSPAAGLTGPINKRFVEALAGGQTILNAWKVAHRAFPDNWAAIIHKECLRDTAVQWAQDGYLKSEPSPESDVLYFDSKTPGRKVEEPKRCLDIKLVRPQADYSPGQPLPSWSGVQIGNLAWICVELTKASGNILESGDRIWISAAQVRPNYQPPFNILELISIYLPKGDSLAKHGIRVLARIHDRRLFGMQDLDTYEFSLPAIKGQKSYKDWIVVDNWLFTDIDQPYRRLFIPIKIGPANFLKIQNKQLKQQGRHSTIPLFYLMGQIKKKDGRTSFGIPDIRPSQRLQKELLDDFQFAVFVLISALPKDRISN